MCEYVCVCMREREKDREIDRERGKSGVCRKAKDT